MSGFLFGLVVFSLGFRHGFDADHLAAVDGLTRFNARANPPLARWCGALFSLGHGTVVIVMSVLSGMLAIRLPGWLGSFGDWVSIFFLILLGLLNLHAVLTAEPGKMVRPAGIRGRIFGRLAKASSPGLVALVGVLFAISFDTLSQAMLFSLSANRMGQSALLMGMIFTLGMLVSDGLNGLWISRLLNRADETALAASKIMGLCVAIISLAVAAFGIARIASPGIGEGGMIPGLLVTGIAAAGFFLARRRA